MLKMKLGIKTVYDKMPEQSIDKIFFLGASNSSANGLRQ